MTDYDALERQLREQVPEDVDNDWSIVLPAGDIRKAADAIRDLRKQDEIHWKTRRTLLAERDALREALREICHRIGNDRSDLAEELRDFARAALAAKERKL